LAWADVEQAARIIDATMINPINRTGLLIELYLFVFILRSSIVI